MPIAVVKPAHLALSALVGLGLLSGCGTTTSNSSATPTSAASTPTEDLTVGWTPLVGDHFTLRYPPTWHGSYVDCTGTPFLPSDLPAHYWLLSPPGGASNGDPIAPQTITPQSTCGAAGTSSGEFPGFAFVLVARSDSPPTPFSPWPTSGPHNCGALESSGTVTVGGVVGQHGVYNDITDCMGGGSGTWYRYHFVANGYDVTITYNNEQDPTTVTEFDKIVTLGLTFT